MSYISQKQAEGCGFCGGSGMAHFKYPRPCPKCQRQCYGEKPAAGLVLKSASKLTPGQERQVSRLIGEEGLSD